MGMNMGVITGFCINILDSNCYNHVFIDIRVKIVTFFLSFPMYLEIDYSKCFACQLSGFIDE